MFTLEIVPDVDPINPRENDRLGTIYYCSNRYILGDKCVDREEISHVLAGKHVIVLPVYAYIHGNVVLNTSGFYCPWDSGQSGCIFVTKEDVRKYFNVKSIRADLRKKVIDILRAEVQEYSDYLSGNVYAFIIKNDDGIVDSCGGFYSEAEAREAGQDAMRHMEAA